MEELKKIAIKQAEEFDKRINNKKSSLALMSVLKINDKANYLQAITGIQSMIHQSIQVGNYRRAVLFIAAANQYLDQMKADEDIAKENLTNIILKKNKQQTRN